MIKKSVSTTGEKIAVSTSEWTEKIIKLTPAPQKIGCSLALFKKLIMEKIRILIQIKALNMPESAAISR